jgi:signal transduction histidine kinase
LGVFFYVVIAHIETTYLDDRIADLRLAAFIAGDAVAAQGWDRLDMASIRGHTNRVMQDRSTNWGYRVLILNDSLQVIFDSAEIRVGQTLVIPEVVYAIQNQTIVTNLRWDEAALYAAAAVVSPRDTTVRVGAVLLIDGVEDIVQSLGNLRRTLLLIIALVSLGVVVIVFIMANMLLRSLRRILKVVQRMATGQLDARIVNVKGRDEYAMLAASFNSMSEKLEQVEKTREEFVSNVSHELKTPLSSMKVLSESILIQESVPEAMYREFLQDIVNEVDRMTSINNDLLALVRIDQREQGLNLTYLSINQMVEDILKRLSPLSEQKDIALIYDDVRPVHIDADEIKLTLAISNIVENGIKYTPNGGTVKVAVDADHQFCYVSVQDTGMGIPEGEQTKIFNRFYRVDKARDRETGGTGLGLAISRAAVAAHGGTIRVTSKPDEGAIFVVRIPLRRGQA